MLDLDDRLSHTWYEALPADFRQRDSQTQLLRYLRLLGDIAGGLDLLARTLAGESTAYPAVLVGPPATTIAMADPPEITGDLHDDGGMIVPIEDPITALDPDDAGVLVITTRDWSLDDPETLPARWLGWYAQLLSISLAGVPAPWQRAWLADPASRLTGTEASIVAAARWHVTANAPIVFTRVSRWRVRITLPAAAVLTSPAELTASVAQMETCGSGVDIVLT